MAIRDDVRLLIPDTDSAVFTDDQINQFVALGGDDAILAAALAIEVIATNEALVFKYVKTNDLMVDGTKVAEVLFKRAKTLRTQWENTASDDFVIVYPFPTTYDLASEDTELTWTLWR